MENLTKALKVVGVLAGLAAFTFLTFYIPDWWSDGPTKRASINPDIFSSFRAIEGMCTREDKQRQTVRCKGALEEIEYCYVENRELYCTAERYYCGLFKLGFDDVLAPYYRPGTKYYGTNPC